MGEIHCPMSLYHLPRSGGCLRHEEFGTDKQGKGNMENKLVVFKGKEIRRILHNNEWYFAVVDVIAALTDSDKPRDYWYRMKKREVVSSGIELSTFCRQLKLWLTRAGGLQVMPEKSWSLRRVTKWLRRKIILRNLKAGSG